MMHALARTAGFLGFWVILTGFEVADVVAGILAAVIATWVSLRLLPPGQWRLRPFALAQLVLRFLRQSIGAGIDVAWRALASAPAAAAGLRGLSAATLRKGRRETRSAP